MVLLAFSTNERFFRFLWSRALKLQCKVPLSCRQAEMLSSKNVAIYTCSGYIEERQIDRTHLQGHYIYSPLIDGIYLKAVICLLYFLQFLILD